MGLANGSESKYRRKRGRCLHQPQGKNKTMKTLLTAAIALLLLIQTAPASAEPARYRKGSAPTSRVQADKGDFISARARRFEQYRAQGIDVAELERRMKKRLHWITPESSEIEASFALSFEKSLAKKLGNAASVERSRLRWLKVSMPLYAENRRKLGDNSVGPSEKLLRTAVRATGRGGINIRIPQISLVDFYTEINTDIATHVGWRHIAGNQWVLDAKVKDPVTGAETAVTFVFVQGGPQFGNDIVITRYLWQTGKRPMEAPEDRVFETLTNGFLKGLIFKRAGKPRLLGESWD